MPRLVFEPMIPVLERAKTFKTLDPAGIVVGDNFVCLRNLQYSIIFILRGNIRDVWSKG
jgi:hypothetical protein